MPLFVHVGQAGNSLAQQLWPRLVQHADRQHRAANPAVNALPHSMSQCLAAAPEYFSSNQFAHAVLIDTEPKVLRLTHSITAQMAIGLESTTAPRVSQRHSCARVDKAATRSIFHSSALLWDQYGRGNNWALGYAGRSVHQTAPASIKGENAMIGECLEAMRQQSERMDVFDSIVLLHSMAGGTGAGMGSRLVESIADEFARVHTTSVIVSPFTSGETPTQHYNATLTLASLCQHADSIVQLHNDGCLALLSSLLTGSLSQSHLQSQALPFTVLNSLLADTLADLLLPAPTATSTQSRHSLASLSSLLSSLQPLPGLKLLEVCSTSGLYEPSEHDSLPWTACADSLVHAIRVSNNSNGTSPATTPATAGTRRGSQSSSSMQSVTAKPSMLTPLEFAVIARGANRFPLAALDCARIEEKLSRVMQSPLSLSVPITGRDNLTATARQSGVPKLGLSRHHGLIGDRWLIDDVNEPLALAPYSLTLLSNDTRCVRRYSAIVSQAQSQWQRQFYTHWFERHDCDTEYFLQACETVRATLDQYQSFAQSVC